LQHSCRPGPPIGRIVADPYNGRRTSKVWRGQDMEWLPGHIDADFRLMAILSGGFFAIALGVYALVL